MEIETYCENLAAELGNWQAKFDGIVRKFDDASCGEKAKLVPQVNDLHMLKEELEERIRRLKTECPTNWEAEKIELEGKFSGFKTRWEDVWQNVSPGDIGG
jgi:predicted nuclease with TOPRIM domain